MSMTSNKPYLIRAFYDWIVDNELTPYILVDASYTGIQVPQEHVRNGLIVLNISPAATRGLLLENDRIVFTARFAGQVEQIFITPMSVLEIYAKENGRGIAFALEEDGDGDGDGDGEPPSGTDNTSSTPSARNKPTLKLVK